MYLKRFQIQKFKSFEDVSLHFNQDLNLLTGINNSGKTTVLEAIALWHECFRYLCRPAGRASKRYQKGQYILGTTEPVYVPYQDILSVRSPNYPDIFYRTQTREPVRLSMAFAAEQQSEELEIAFEIKAANGLNYQLRHHSEGFDYALFK